MRKFLKSPLGITIIAAFLTPVATLIVDAITKKTFFTTLLSVVKCIWSWLITFLTFELKVWWVLLGAGVVIGILIIISKLYDAKHKDSDPEFVSYKEDNFGGWKWSWRWCFNKIDKTWDIEDNSIIAHCPNCETPMMHDHYETSFECPRCQFKTDYSRKHKTSHEVKVLIIDNVKRRNNV